MHVTGNAIVFDEAEVIAVVRQIVWDFNADIVQFLPCEGGGDDGVDITRLVIPLEGSIIMGMAIAMEVNHEAR